MVARVALQGCRPNNEHMVMHRIGIFGSTGATRQGSLPPGCSPRRVANAQCSPHIERSGKEGKLMVKRYIRWILPLVVIVLIGVYFLVSPMVATHAAGPAAPAAPSQITTPHGQTPDFYWHH